MKSLPSQILNVSGNKMKILLILLISSFSTFGYSQSAKFREIKFRPNPEFYNTKDFTIIYPIIITQNEIVNKKINNLIRDEIVQPFTEKKSLKQDLTELIKDGLTDLSYQITFNKNGILSINIAVQESGGHHLIYTETYFNFDLKTGNNLSISDIFQQAKLESFTTKVLNDKISYLQSYKLREAKNYIDKNEVDSSVINMAIQDCISITQFEAFSLSKKYIEIISPCRFHYSMRALEPEYKLKYSLHNVSDFLKKEFKRLLLK